MGVSYYWVSFAYLSIYLWTFLTRSLLYLQHADGRSFFPN
jgi:hypothetical protein